MLKGIPSILSPDLLKVLMEMGHGDEIVIADGNYPGASHGQRLLRADGHGVPELLKAILQFFPLDTYAQPTYLMAKPDNVIMDTPIWETYKQIVAQHTDVPVAFLERFAFYERSKSAYVILMTGEPARYANIILKKGVVIED